MKPRRLHSDTILSINGFSLGSAIERAVFARTWVMSREGRDLELQGQCSKFKGSSKLSKLQEPATIQRSTPNVQRPTFNVQGMVPPFPCVERKPRGARRVGLRACTDGRKALVFPPSAAILRAPYRSEIQTPDRIGLAILQQESAWNGITPKDNSSVARSPKRNFGGWWSRARSRMRRWCGVRE